MQCAGFVLTDENDEVLAVSVDGSSDLIKSHVKGFVRKDGTVVKEHDDKRQKAFDHPHVVGHAQNLQGGGADKAHSFDFGGKTYVASGKSGTSSHDNTPVRHFQEQTKDGEDSGRHLWLDGKSRVHADSKDEVDELRAGNQDGEQSEDKSKPIPTHIAEILGQLAASLSADGVAPDKIKAAVDGILAIQEHIPAPKK